MTKKIYNKLIRDRVTEICEAKGIKVVTRELDSEEYLQELLNKLVEEANETREDPSPEELADVLEVLTSIAKTLGLAMEDIESVRKQKKVKRGGFEKRIFLISTEEK
jgi:predicted house-cleaning noncanonical NTP pyrophosphatase (MazG superfamily)